MNATYHALSLGKMFGFIFILIPFTLYCLWITWKDRDELYIQKRHPLIIIGIALIQIGVSFYWIFFDEVTCYFDFCRNASLSLHQIILMLFVCITMALITIRVWFLYYDLKYGQAILNNEWWQTITNQTNWFIENKNKYGSLKQFMYKRIILFMICWIILICFGAYYSNTLYLVSATMIPDLFWLFMLYCFCKMPKHYDIFSIRKEINRLTMFYLIPTLWYAITRGSNIDSKYIVISWISGYLIIFYSSIITAMITLWPHYEIKEINNYYQENKKNNYLWLQWQNYINHCDDDVNWNKFMRHLIREIAVENLCFVLEAMQYKKQLIDKDLDINDDNIDTIGWFMELPNDLPKSAIIENNKNEYKLQIKRIYEKYISFDAMLAINISYESRKEFENSLESIMKYSDDEIKNKLLKIFDNILRDVSNNLDGSFYRFQFEEQNNDSTVTIETAMSPSIE